MAFTFLTANQEDGFSEALLRGLRSSFLTDLDYSNLKEGGQRGGAAREDRVHGARASHARAQLAHLVRLLRRLALPVRDDGRELRHGAEFRPRWGFALRRAARSRSLSVLGN